MGPAAVVVVRGSAWPLRTTRRRPASSCSGRRLVGPADVVEAETRLALRE